jgi:hypothetical protein
VTDCGEGPTISSGPFPADGTSVHEGYAGGPLAFGGWEPTGEHSADLRSRPLDVWEDRVVEVEARAALTVEEAGSARDGPNVSGRRYLDAGTIASTDEAVSEGTRIEPAPMVSLETLIAETEVQATPVP